MTETLTIGKFDEPVDTLAAFDALAERIAELEAEVLRLKDNVDTLEDEVISLEETLLDYESEPGR